MARDYRLVVTEQTGEGGAIVSDGAVPGVFDLDVGRVVEVWRAGPGGARQDIGPEWSLDPPPGGSLLRIAEFPPGDADSPAWMHITETIDYVLVLEGEVVLVTDRGETTLRQGEMVVQQGASHGWVNRTDKPCRIAVVMIHAAQA